MQFAKCKFTYFLACIFLMVAGDAVATNCNRPVLANEARDADTIQKLEDAWSRAFLSGDTEFEACLLAPDFEEIMSDGRINHLSDELALAEKNKGKDPTHINLPQPTVHLHDDVAVAYGISSEKLVDGKPHKSYYADYYFWKDGAWHVYFAQQTSFPVATASSVTP